MPCPSGTPATDWRTLGYGLAERGRPARVKSEPPLRLNDEAISICQGPNVINGQPGFASQRDQPGIADLPRCRLIGDDQRGDPRRYPGLIADSTTRSGSTRRRSRSTRDRPLTADVG